MIKYMLIGVILILGTLLGFIAWITNIFVAYPQWGLLQVDFISEWFKTLQTIPPFYWFVPVYLVKVDLSMVTTGLVAATFLFACIGLYRTIKGYMPQNMDFFPFWPTYKNFYVQLGLIGTLWGFIIAFREVSPEVSPEDPTTMLLALGTALWSTFSAIFLAFVVCPLIFEKWLFGYVLGINKDGVDFDSSNQPVKKEIQEISKSFAELSGQVNSTTIKLRDLSKEISDFESVQEALRQVSIIKHEMDKLKNDKIPAIEKTAKAIEEGVSSIKEQFILKEEVKEQNSIFGDQFTKLETRLTRIEERLLQAEFEMKHIKGTHGILTKIRDLINSR